MSILTQAEKQHLLVLARSTWFFLGAAIAACGSDTGIPSISGSPAGGGAAGAATGIGGGAGAATGMGGATTGAGGSGGSSVGTGGARPDAGAGRDAGVT